MINVEVERKIAIEILGLFEDFLDEKDITIPSADRHGDADERTLEQNDVEDQTLDACERVSEHEARLYGSEYYALEDKITEIIKNYFCSDSVEIKRELEKYG